MKTNRRKPSRPQSTLSSPSVTSSWNVRSTQRNRSTKYPLHRSMFFWLANFSLFNWLVTLFCFYGILLGDQLQNKFAWDFNYFLCCWLETAESIALWLTFDYWNFSVPEAPDVSARNVHRVSCCCRSFFIITNEMHHYWRLWSAFDFKSRGWWCNRAQWSGGVKEFWRCSGERSFWSFLDSPLFIQFRIKFFLAQWCYSSFLFHLLCTRGLS